MTVSKIFDQERFFYKIMKNMFQERLKEANEAKIEKVKCKRKIKEIEATMTQLYKDKIKKSYQSADVFASK